MNFNIATSIICLTFFCLTPKSSKSQKNTISKNCESIKQISFLTYKSNFTRANKLNILDKFLKSKGLLTIKTKRKSIKLKDEFEGNEAIISYSIFGQIKEKNWIFIKELGLNNETYYLINTSNSHIDTLVGKPQIYNNGILCLEGSYTDSPGYIELYSISNDKIKIKYKISLARCNLFTPTNIFLKNRKIFMTDINNNKSWLIKYE